MRRFLTMAVLVGCATTTRNDAINTAFTAASATQAGFLIYDRDHEMAIVTGSATLDDGKAKLAAYRASRSRFNLALESTFRAIGIAGTLNDSQSLDAIKSAISQLTAAYTAIKAAP